MESICRCCLGQNASHNLFVERKLAQRFVICTSLMLDILDDFPKLICHNCYEMLLKCYDFQIMCAESNDSFLNKQFNTNLLLKICNNKEDVVEEDFMLEQIEVILEEQKLQGMEEVYIVNNDDSTATDVQNEKVASFTNCTNPKHSQQDLTSEGAPLQSNETSAKSKLHYCTFEGCSRVYSAKRSLCHHIKEFHLGNATNKGEYICEVCGKIFERKVYLSRHRYVHMDKSEYPFGCEYCGKRFYTKQFLRDHLYRHAGIKMFICNHCGIHKPTKDALQQHINCCHNAYEKKLWKCSKCDKGFGSSSNLKVHITSVHECRRAFACRFCDQRFSKLDTMRNHEMRHTGLKPNKCNICERAFIQKGALNIHQLRVHNVK